MNKKLLTVLIALLFTPVFVVAENAITTFFLGDPCLVPVYNTNFVFPSEGGKIVQVGNSYYFVKTYESGCENVAAGAIVIRTADQGPIQTPPPLGGGGNIVTLLSGDPCLVPVYNTAFAFPSEGGKIVQIGSNFFFVKTYLSGCENAGSNGTTVRSAGQDVVQTPPPNTGGGSIVNFIIGDPCLVPVYNTVFAFPAEGGKIVAINGSNFFVKTYLPGCENAGSGGTVIRSQ